MKKLVTTMFILAAMLTSNVTVSFASEGNTTHEHKHETIAQVMNRAAQVMPRAAYCGNCGNMSLMVTSSYRGDYLREIEKECVHYVYGTDKIHTYWYHEVYECGSCGYLDNLRTTRDYIVECHGYT